MKKIINYKEAIFLIFLAFSPVMGAFGSQLSTYCEISGTVKDSATGEGLPYASIMIVSQNNPGSDKGAIADINGNYSIKDIIPGEYKLVVSYMGYNEFVTVLDIRGKKEKHDLLISRKNISLSEVEVTAEKSLIEKNIEKTIVNVAENKTLAGGTATDVIQTLPSVDIDIDGNINYRGSDKVIILLNGEKSGLVKSLDQIPAEQVEKIELINNPSAKHDAEGMSGIINIVLKSGKSDKNKTTIMLNAGYPETLGGNVGYSGMSGKTRFFINAGLNHNTKYQTKEHFRENYENPEASNYYQFDRQDENLNSAIINSTLEYAVNKKQQIGLSLIASKKLNSAGRKINYETQNKTGLAETSLKEIDINLNNYAFDASVNYRYTFKKDRQFLKAGLHYSLFDQAQLMDNKYYPTAITDYTELQNTSSGQLNKEAGLSLDYSHPLNDLVLFETGYNFSTKDLSNDFYSESSSVNTPVWTEDTLLSNKFGYVQQIHASYLNISARLKHIEIMAGLRAEYTNNKQNYDNKNEYLDFFPSMNISRKLNNNFTVFAGYNRRINRPTIKMLNPFTDEYADILNMHKGNPELKPEYVNSFEVGSRFIFNKFSGFASVYYRDIDQAVSRIKSASNDSALVVSFMNLDKATQTGGELAISWKLFDWWIINTSGNIFYTGLTGEYVNNKVNNSKTGWNANISNSFKLPGKFGFQLMGYYRSKLPSVTGTYKERYYMDIAVNKKLLKNNGQLIFKVSDVLDTYKFGLDLDAVDDNNYRYSQTNRRKNESRYFVVSFTYNINGKEQQKKKQNDVFFLDDFDK